MSFYNSTGNYFTSKDFDVKKDIEKQARRSTKRRKEKARNVRELYLEKIRKVKKKVLEQFNEEDKVDLRKFKVYGGKGGDTTKDMIVVNFDVNSDDNQNKILKAVLDFLYQAFELAKLNQFFIPKNFGDQEVLENHKVELLFLKQNHSYERIKSKPYFTPDSGEGEGEEGLPAGEGPPSGGGGFGGAPPGGGGGPDIPEPEGGPEEEPEEPAGGEEGGEEEEG